MIRSNIIKIRLSRFNMIRQFTFKILKVSWAADPTTYPSNYLILKFTDPVTLAPKEDHCYIRSVTVDATHLIVNLRARNIQQMQVPLLTTNVANIGAC